MGLFSWGKKVTKTNVDAGKKIVGSEDIKKNAEFIKEMASKLTSTKTNKTETFLDAKNRLKISDIDIAQNYKNQVYSFYVSLVCAILCFLGIIYNLFIVAKIMPALSMLAIMSVCLANSFRFSFRAFQIKHQKLCSTKEWWDRASEWFPKLP
jgi:hypothetical protein